MVGIKRKMNELFGNKINPVNIGNRTQFIKKSI